MNVVENLKPDVQRYLRLRRVLRTVEFVCLVALLIVFLYTGGENLARIIGCLAIVIIIPEVFLAVQRWGVETSIKYAKLLEEKDLDFYSKQKEEAEKMKKELILQETNPNLTIESLKIIEKEKLNFGWISNKIKYYKFLCDDLEQQLKQLNELKRLVNY